jgi:ATP-dependent Clp protease ATP-binding subunit ClpC
MPEVVMGLFADGKLNPQAFDSDVRQATHDLSDLLLAVANTQSDLVESTHLLMVLARVRGGITARSLDGFGLSLEQWETGLGDCAAKPPGAMPPAHLTNSVLHASAKLALDAAEARSTERGEPRISEAVLLLAALENATRAVRDLFQSADINWEDWLKRIKDRISRPNGFVIFTPDGALDVKCLSPGARKVLGLARAEAESLGHTVLDPRHLLLALCEFEGGALQHGMHLQGISTRRVHEGVMLNLRASARRQRTTLTLARNHMQKTLAALLTAAADQAAQAGHAQVAEPHLLLGFLAMDSSALRLLRDERVDLASLRTVAEDFDVGEEPEETADVATTETVRQRLRSRVIGQDHVIERVLPYIQRMRFGFTTPGRPVGVFLFCGQSGTGKTELAKGLAHAIYGSEENMIFLEMGQFNSPESMNIFVGAPPGYVGYGEGKLTNSLRDKPQAVVLFDEVEKAHAKVLDALLRFLDEGRIDDPAGPVRDGSHCVVILTSNVGADELSRLWAQVKDNPNERSILREKLRELFRKHQFRPEFLNRVDEIILFSSLTSNDYGEIAAQMIARHSARLSKERGIELTVDPGVHTAIGQYCEAIGEGARATARLVQTVVMTPVIDFLVSKECSGPVRLSVALAGTQGESPSEPHVTVQRT